MRIEDILLDVLKKEGNGFYIYKGEYYSDGNPFMLEEIINKVNDYFYWISGKNLIPQKRWEKIVKRSFMISDTSLGYHFDNKIYIPKFGPSTLDCFLDDIQDELEKFNILFK